MTPQQIELALETIALVLEDLKKTQEKQQATIIALEEALVEHAMSEVQRLGQEIEQEPVGYVYSESGVKSAAIQRDLPNGTPLFTTPPQRTWVGLTDEEIWTVLQFRGYNTDTIEIARAIEARLKEKNT